MRKLRFVITAPAGTKRSKVVKLLKAKGFDMCYYGTIKGYETILADGPASGLIALNTTLMRMDPPWDLAVVPGCPKD
jgi:hypothetical protein